MEPLDPTPLETPADPAVVTQPLETQADLHVEAARQADKPDDTARADALAKLPDAVRSAFDGELDDDELAAVAQGITPETLQALPPASRAALRAILKSQASEATAREEAHTKREAEYRAREAAFEQKQRSIRQREAALLNIATSKAAQDPGAPPEVDPLTAEGQSKLAEYWALKAQAQAQAPLRERAAVIDRQQRWEAIQDEHPELRDDKVGKEFLTYVQKLNEGIDPTKEKPRVPAAEAARMFFNERELKALRAEQQKARDAVAGDRQAAARSMARTTQGGTSTLTDTFDNLMRKGDVPGAVRYLETNPAAKAAVSARNNVRA